MSIAVVEGGLPSAFAADSAATKDVLMKVHQTNHKEIEMGKVAEKKGVSKEVKEFGKMLVKDHTAADQKAMSLAKKEKIELGKVEPKTAEAMEMGKGADFDAQFARMMLDDHKKDISELTDARDNTKDEALKEYLTAILPTLKKHQAEAEKIVDMKKK
jgi:putative membrane protein